MQTLKMRKIIVMQEVVEGVILLSGVVKEWALRNEGKRAPF